MPDINDFLNSDGTMDVSKLEMSTKLPFGEYVAKLADIKTVMSKFDENTPQLDATFEVLSGPHEGRSLHFYYDLKATAPQEAGGKVRARGISDFVIDIKNAGGEIKSVPWQKPTEMRKIYATHLGKKKLKLSLSERQGTGEYAGKSYTNRRVLGIVDGPAPMSDGEGAATASTSDDLA